MAVDPNAIDFIAKAVSKYGIDPTQTIDVTDPMTRLTMAVMITDIEQGRDIYSYDQFVKGAALSSGMDPDSYNVLINAVSLGFENFVSAGGFVSPANPTIALGGSSVPTNYSAYVQAGETSIKAAAASIDSTIAATQAILSVNTLNGINPLTGQLTTVNTDNPLGSLFSGIGQKISNAVSTVTDALGITTTTAVNAVTGAITQITGTGSNVVLLGTGSNNWSGTSLADLTKTISSTISAVKDNGGQVVIMLPAPTVNGSTIPRQAAQAAADAAGVKAIDPVNYADGIHPSTTGYNNVAAGLKDLGIDPKSVTCVGDSTCVGYNQRILGMSNGTTATAVQSQNANTILGYARTVSFENPTAASSTSYIRTEQIPAMTDASKAAENTAKAAGYTTKVPLANADGQIVGATYINPIDKSYIVYNNVNGTLKNADGSTIKTAADLPPTLSDSLTAAGYTEKQQLPNGSVRWFTSDPSKIDNYVEISLGGAYKYSGAAQYDVQANFTGKQLDYFGITKISSDVSNTPLFAGTLATDNTITAAQKLSIGVVNPIGSVGYGINTAFAGGFSVVGGQKSQDISLNFNNTLSSVDTEIARYQNIVNTQDTLKQSYTASENVINDQLTVLRLERQVVESSVTDAQQLQTQAVIEKQREINTANDEVKYTQEKIEQLETNIANSPDADLIKGWTEDLIIANKQLSDAQFFVELATNQMKDIQDGKVEVDPNNGTTLKSILEQKTEIDSQIRILESDKQFIADQKQAVQTQYEQASQAIVGLASARNIAVQTTTLPQQILDAGNAVDAASSDVFKLKALLENPGTPSLTKIDLQAQLADASQRFNDATKVYRDLKDEQASAGQVQGPNNPAGWTNSGTTGSSATTTDIVSDIAVPAGSNDEAMQRSLQDPESYYKYVDQNGTETVYVNGKEVNTTTGAPIDTDNTVISDSNVKFDIPVDDTVDKTLIGDGVIGPYDPSYEIISNEYWSAEI